MQARNQNQQSEDEEEVEEIIPHYVARVCRNEAEQEELRVQRRVNRKRKRVQAKKANEAKRLLQGRKCRCVVCNQLLGESQGKKTKHLFVCAGKRLKREKPQIFHELLAEIGEEAAVTREEEEEETEASEPVAPTQEDTSAGTSAPAHASQGTQGTARRRQRIGIACEFAGCESFIGSRTKVHIEIFVRGEGTAGEKLTFCSVRHFKRGDRAIEPIKERLEQLVSEVDVRAMRKTQECGNCKNRCHAVLSLVFDRLVVLGSKAFNNLVGRPIEVVQKHSRIVEAAMPRTGRPSSLTPIDLLLLFLLWCRHYISDALLAFIFGISRSTVTRNLEFVRHTLLIHVWQSAIIGNRGLYRTGSFE